MLTYGSVCSGIEATSVAWEPLGFKPKWFAEIDAFPSAVLAYHFPHVPNLGDFTKIGEEHGPVDVLVGGTPCQSFSIAGARAGVADPRGQLSFEFLTLAGRVRPTWVVWENVPGVLSIDGGAVFGAFLGGLAQLGYGFAYRVLDAQYAGVPQRRRRVFVVGYLGDWRPAAAVLFERHSLSWDPPPRREVRQGDTYDIAPCLRASGRGVARPGESHGQDPVIPVAFGHNNTSGPVPVSVRMDRSNNLHEEPVTGSLTCGGGRVGEFYAAVRIGYGVRRLTPRECERLMGLPDDWTLVPYRGKPAADGPRYKSIGNSMAVPVMRWIGERILIVNELVERKETS